MTHATEQPRRETSFWDEFWAASRVDNARRATLTLSAQVSAELLRDEQVDRVLDLGCGLGEVAVLLAQQIEGTIVAVDLSERAVSETRDAAARASLRKRVLPARADCYHLGFADGAFDAVISFGYASAASYEGAEREVARVLRPGGVAIIDFRNLSVYNTLLNPRSGWRIWRRFLRRDKVYNLGPVGLAEHFRPAGLELEAVRYFNTYPPAGNRVATDTYLRIEQFGRRIGRPLARVLAAKFRRVGTA